MVSQQGAELTIGDAGRTYSTTECWEQYPGLARVSHVGGARNWRTVCRTASTDPRQASVITTLSATDTTIIFDETGQYQFVIQGQNCTASVRRSRSFSLIQREGELPLAQSNRAAAATSSKESGASRPTRLSSSEQEQRCVGLGPPARLEVRPSRKLMRPGEQFAFRSSVLDAHGCLLKKVVPAWRLVDPNSPARFVSPGLLAVNGDAPETEVALNASVHGQSVKVVVAIASTERYEALLRQGGFNGSGESQQAAVAAIASGSLGGRTTVTRGESPARRYLLAAILGAAAVVLAGLVFVVVRRSRERRTEARTSDGLTALAYPDPSGACLACGQAYPSGVTVCPADGAQVVPMTRSSSTVAVPSSGQGPPLLPDRQKICPVCGERFAPDAQFCGADGAMLVPEN